MPNKPLTNQLHLALKTPQKALSKEMPAIHGNSQLPVKEYHPRQKFAILFPQYVPHVNHMKMLHL